MTRPFFPNGRVAFSTKMGKLKRLGSSRIMSVVMAIWFGGVELRTAIRASRSTALPR